MPVLNDEQQHHLADLIHRESYDYYSLISGARLHKVPPETALQLAWIITRAALKHNVPLVYLLAVLRQESAFDPKARNPNLQRNPQYKLEFTDYGIAQIAGRNLLTMFPDPSDPFRDKEYRTKRMDEAILMADARRIRTAEDPAWAVEWAAATYRRLINLAKERFPGSDPLTVATLFYNTGVTGGSAILRKQAPANKIVAGWKHVRRVLDHYRRFLKEVQS